MPIQTAIPNFENGFAPRDGEPAYPSAWDGLAGAWEPTLGNTGPTLRDISGRNNHGTINGATWVAGERGPVLLFSGAGDVDLAPSLQLSVTNRFTFVIRAKIDNVTTNQYLYGRDPSVAGEQHAIISGFSSGNVEFFAVGFSGSDPRTGSQLAIPDTTRIHQYTYAYDGVTWSGYIDGKQVFSVSRTFSLAPTLVSVRAKLGADSVGGSNFSGLIDQFIAHRRALTDNQVTDLFENPSRLTTLASQTIPVEVAAPGVGSPWYQYAQEAAVAG